MWLIVCKIGRLLSIWIGLWLLSALVALSLRVFLFCASIIVLPICKLLFYWLDHCCPHDISLAQLLRAMPWFGFYAAYFKRTRGGAGCLSCGLGSFFLFFYIVFNYVAQISIRELLIVKSYAHSFPDMFLVAVLTS